jgi:hypothetical protein
MKCHECARIGIDRPAIGLCRFCFVGLCKAHVVASFHSDVVPQYGCNHAPERAFAPARQTQLVSSQLAHATR